MRPPTRGGLAGRHGVLFSSAAGGAYWLVAIRCPSLGPLPSIGGGAHRPLTTPGGGGGGGAGGAVALPWALLLLQSATRSGPDALPRCGAAAKWPASVGRRIHILPRVCMCSVQGDGPRTGGAGSIIDTPRRGGDCPKAHSIDRRLHHWRRPATDQERAAASCALCGTQVSHRRHLTATVTAGHLRVRPLIFLLIAREPLRKRMCTAAIV